MKVFKGTSACPSSMAHLVELLCSWLPEQAKASGIYCRPCADMLGTESGVQKLCSPGGYCHLTKENCQRSAERGCQLCSIIYDRGWRTHRLRGDGTYSVPPAEPSCLDYWTMPKSLYFFSQKSDKRASEGLPEWGDKSSSNGSFDGVGWLVGRVLSQTRTRVKFWSHVVTFALLASPGIPYY